MSESVQEAPAILVRGLRKSFGGPPVLRDLDLRVGWGEVFVLFGANGSGKTTLIRSLATLTRFDGGAVQIAGRDLHANAVFLRRSLGVLTHQTFLYDDLTAFENLQFYGRMFGVPQLGVRIRCVTEQMGLYQLLGRRVRTLSHGMQKRFSLARALLHDPNILFLDEPETGLDREAMVYLDGLLTGPEMARRATVMTTHNLDWGLALGSHVAILSNGRIAYQRSRDGLDKAEFRSVYDHYLSEVGV